MSQSEIAVECAYSVEGSGPSLILVHGIGASRDAWRFLLPLLREHFTCISYDLRGHGVSPKPEGAFSLDDLVTDLEFLRDRLDVENAHIAGHSLGGMIGPAYARRYPHRVLSLCLLSTAAGRSEEDRKRVNAVVDQVENQGVANTLPALVNRWFTDEFIAVNQDLVQMRLNQVEYTDPDVFLNVFKIYAETEMGPWLSEIGQPALVLTGELDGGCNPRLNRYICEQLPNSELVIMDGYKHAILLEAGELVARHIIRFIEGVS